MNEPRRWLEDPQTPDSLRQVLSAATDVPPLPSETHAHASAFAAGLVSQGLPAKAAAASLWAKSTTSLLGAGSTGKAVLVLSLMGAAGTGSYLIAARQSSSTPVPHHAAAVVAVQSSPSQRVGELSQEAETQVTPAADSPEEPPRRSPTSSSQERAPVDHERDDAPMLPKPHSPSAGRSSVAPSKNSPSPTKRDCSKEHDRLWQTTRRTRFRLSPSISGNTQPGS